MENLRSSEDYAAAIRCLCAKRKNEHLADEQFFPELNALSVSWSKAYDSEMEGKNAK